jgi:hypothetical protein
MGWKNANLRSEMTRLLRRAGVSGWPRLFHSMRASRQTELQREFPIHVVCSWLGNSPRIAQQSYLLFTEDDFAKAAGVAKGIVPPPSFCPKRSILAGLFKFLAVGYGLNEIARSANSSCTSHLSPDGGSLRRVIAFRCQKSSDSNIQPNPIHDDAQSPGLSLVKKSRAAQGRRPERRKKGKRAKGKRVTSSSASSP